MICVYSSIKLEFKFSCNCDTIVYEFNLNWHIYRGRRWQGHKRWTLTPLLSLTHCWSEVRGGVPMGRGSGLSGEDGLITPQPVILWQLPPTNDTEMGERWSLTDQPEMHATPPEQIFSCLWDNLFYWTLGKLSKTIQLCSNSINFMSPAGGSRAGL